jgi:hypothetical protein
MFNKLIKLWVVSTERVICINDSKFGVSPIKFTYTLVNIKNIFREKKIVILYLTDKWIWGDVEVCFTSIEIEMIAVGLFR